MDRRATVAYIFPGQGSQSVGMLSGILEYQIVKSLFDKASVVLNYDLLSIINDGPSEKLNQTIFTQPALFITSYALYHIHLEKYGIEPMFLAGHSLGEYSALACANALGFEETVFLVSKRAELMQNAVPNDMGAMAAIIGLEDDMIKDICNGVDNVVGANFNSPGQVVISGERKSVELVISIAKEKGAKLAKLLPVSVPSHSPLMKDAARQFTQHIENSSIIMPQTDVISNVTAKPYSSVSNIKELLLRQLYEPVEWVKSVRYMQANGAISFVECGPGKVLAGLSKRIDKSIPAISGYDFAAVDELLKS